MLKKYDRPEPSEQEKVEITEFTHKLINSYGFSKLKLLFIMICFENWRLTKEVNEHRASLGFEPLPTFKPKL
jgi:hypothetical protein